MSIENLVISFGAAGAPQPITIAEQVYAGMPVGHGTVTQDRWRANPVTVNGIVFTLFPGLDSDGRADCWVCAAYGEAPVAQVYSPINREFAAVDLQVTLNGVAQNLFGAGTTYSYNHQRATWLRWQSVSVPWDTSAAFINARVADGTFLRHDSHNVFGAADTSYMTLLPTVSGYQPFKTFCDISQSLNIGDQPRSATQGAERTAIGPAHEWFARLISEVGTNNNVAWLTPVRLQVLKDLAETAAQFPHASGLLEPVTNRLLDPSVKPHCSHDNPNAWNVATGVPQPGLVDDVNQYPYNCAYDNAHPLNKFSFQAYHLSKDPFHLLQVQGQAVTALTYQTPYNGGRGSDGKILRLAIDQERALWWGLQMLVQAWHATPTGAMPKPFRDKAWFATAIDNTLQFLRDRLMSAVNHIEPGVIGEAMRYWRVTSKFGPYPNGEVRASRFQEDYGNIVLAQAMLLGYSAGRDVAEWHAVNIQRRLELGGSWFLNDYELELNEGSASYTLGPSTGSLPYSNAAEFKAWYPRKAMYTDGPVSTDFWRQQYGRDTYLFVAALNVTKEAARRGLMTLGFNAAAEETALRARFTPPFTSSVNGLPLNYHLFAKQYFNYQGAAIVPAPADNYETSGQTMRFGKSAPPSVQPFDSVTVASDDGLGTASGPLPHFVVMNLHESGSGTAAGLLNTGKQYRAQVSGLMAHDGQTEFKFSLARSANYYSVLLVRPVDHYGYFPTNNGNRESMWLGFSNIGQGSAVRLLTKRRLDANVVWQDENLVDGYNHKLRCLTGGSMGAWGAMTYGPRNPDKFAAVYPDRPRWRYAGDNVTLGKVAVSNYLNMVEAYTVANSPNLVPEDGGGSYAAYLDMIAYCGNPANEIPPILWCVGRQDGYTPFSDHIAAVAALRAAKRVFAFAWNDGNHGATLTSQILQSYPYGLFEIGKGRPLFTEHSGDQDPAVDLVGGINIGLTFKPGTLVETPTTFSCEVTSVLGARTVKVEPVSKVFKAAVAPQLVDIPAANTWVTVTFNA